MQPHLIPALQLPAIGATCHGGKFAGILTGNDGVPYALILLADKPAADAGPDRNGRLPWQAAIDWARQGLGADLPTRPESALLFQLLKADFDEAWHWTNETTSWSKSSAWLQYFSRGYQTGNGQSYAGRCRAVRRLPLQFFSPLAATECSAEGQVAAAATDSVPA